MGSGRAGQGRAGRRVAGPAVLTEEQFLAREGAGADFGDAGLHRSDSRVSGRARRSQLDLQSRRDEDLAARREVLRERFRAEVASGRIREPTRIERFQQVASGHTDNESVQAARRVLKRLGIEVG